MPQRLATDVGVDTEIRIYFSKTQNYFPLDSGTVTSSSVYLSDNGSHVACSLSVVDNGYTIRMVPNSSLTPSTHYQVTVLGDIDMDGTSEGVADINGTPMAGAYQWWFTTAGTAVPIPILHAPSNNTVTDTPTLQWSVEGSVDSFEVQISQNPTFEAATTITTEATSITPNITLGHIYYWRVRAIQDSTYSNWSLVWHFRYEAQTDTPAGSLLVLSTSPQHNAVNIESLETIRLQFSADIDPLSLLDAPIYITRRSNL